MYSSAVSILLGPGSNRTGRYPSSIGSGGAPRHEAAEQKSFVRSLRHHEAVRLSRRIHVSESPFCSRGAGVGLPPERRPGLRADWAVSTRAGCTRSAAQDRSAARSPIARGTPARAPAPRASASADRRRPAGHCRAPPASPPPRRYQRPQYGEWITSSGKPLDPSGPRRRRRGLYLRRGHLALLDGRDALQEQESRDRQDAGEGEEGRVAEALDEPAGGQARAPPSQAEERREQRELGGAVALVADAQEQRALRSAGQALRAVLAGDGEVGPGAGGARHRRQRGAGVHVERQAAAGG